MRYCAQGAPARARSLTLAGCGTGAHPAAYATFQADARPRATRYSRSFRKRMRRGARKPEWLPGSSIGSLSQ